MSLGFYSYSGIVDLTIDVFYPFFLATLQVLINNVYIELGAN